MIHLTFDDGPNGDYTRAILDVLAEHDLKATFFVIGKWVKEQPAVVREVAAAGHAIGNHTFSHPQMSTLTFDECKRNIEKCDEYLCSSGVEPDMLFRAPFGDCPQPFRHMHTHWNIHGGDWAASSVEEITAPIFRYCDSHDSAIVLLHDGYHKELGADRSLTVEATRRILERYPRERFANSLTDMRVGVQ